MIKTLTNHQKKKKKSGLCVSTRCMKPRAHHSNYCHSCKKKIYAKNNPEAYKYMVLRNNAKRRGKDFTLTLNEFIDFLKENPNYMTKCGRRVKSLQIDRIDNSKGYSKDNIQCITLAENIHKYNTQDINENSDIFGEVDPDVKFSKKNSYTEGKWVYKKTRQIDELALLCKWENTNTSSCK